MQNKKQRVTTFAKLLKLPNVIKPLEIAGAGDAGPASGDGV